MSPPPLVVTVMPSPPLPGSSSEGVSVDLLLQAATERANAAMVKGRVARVRFRREELRVITLSSYPGNARIKCTYQT